MISETLPVDSEQHIVWCLKLFGCKPVSRFDLCIRTQHHNLLHAEPHYPKQEKWTNNLKKQFSEVVFFLFLDISFVQVLIYVSIRCL